MIAEKRLFGMRTNGRFETRVLLRLAVLMRNPSHPSLTDLGLTENVSPRGARIVTKRFRKPGETCEIADLSGSLYVSARIVYCERLVESQLLHGIRAAGLAARLVARVAGHVHRAGREKQPSRTQRCPLNNSAQPAEKQLRQVEPCLSEMRLRIRVLTRSGSFSTGSSPLVRCRWPRAGSDWARAETPSRLY